MNTQEGGIEVNNGYRLSPSGLLVKPETIDDTPTGHEDRLPAVAAADDSDTRPLQPVPQTVVAPADVALAADAAGDEVLLWGAGNMPAPMALQAAVSRARQAVALQESDELRLAKSPEDVREDLSQARRHRDAYRAYEDRVYRDRLAELDAGRAHARVLAKHERKRNEDAAEAGQRLAQLLDPTAALIRLQRARRWAPRVALLPAVFAVAAGAVNVGTQLSRINPATAWVNWAIEPLFTLPILAILIAQIAGAIPSVAEALTGVDTPTKAFHAVLGNQYARVEAGLFLVAVALNVGLHFAGPGADGSSGSWVWMVVPAGLVVSMYLVPKLLSDLTAKFVAAKSTLPQPVTPGVTPVTYSDNPAAPPRLGNPSRVEEITAELRELIASGQWEGNLSAKPIRERFRCGMDEARAVRDLLTAQSNTVPLAGADQKGAWDD